MQSEETQEVPTNPGSEPLVVPLASQRDSTHGEDASREGQSDNRPEASTDGCMIASIAGHPANGYDHSRDDYDDEEEIVGLMLVTPIGTTPEAAPADPDAAVEAAYSILGQSSLDEVKALEARAVLAQAEADPTHVRDRAMDMLKRSEEEAHGIVESAARVAASRTTRAEVQAKLTMDKARERADLLIASAQLRSELLIEEACKTAVFDVEQETRVKCDAIVDEAKVDAKAKIRGAAEEARDIVDRARRQGDEIVAAAEFDAEERRAAASEMFAAIESLEQKVEEDARLAAEASALAATEVLDEARRDADVIRSGAIAIDEEARAQADMMLRNAHTRSEQIIAGADETAAWFAERVQSRETIVREATEAHVNELLERAEATSLELLLNARERCTEMIANAQTTVDRMLIEGRRAAQDLVGEARSQAAAEGPPARAAAHSDRPNAVQAESAEHGEDSQPSESGGFAGLWNHSVDDDALDEFFAGVADRSEDEVFSP